MLRPIEWYDLFHYNFINVFQIIRFLNISVLSNVLVFSSGYATLFDCAVYYVFYLSIQQKNHIRVGAFDSWMCWTHCFHTFKTPIPLYNVCLLSI